MSVSLETQSALIAIARQDWYNSHQSNGSHLAVPAPSDNEQLLSDVGFAYAVSISPDTQQTAPSTTDNSADEDSASGASANDTKSTSLLAKNTGTSSNSALNAGDTADTADNVLPYGVNKGLVNIVA